MSDRVTDKHLQAVIDRINRETGSPMSPYLKQADGTYKAQVGNYHLDSNLGGVALERMYNEDGGVQVILHRGTKRDLLERMHSWLSGLEARKANPKYMILHLAADNDRNGNPRRCYAVYDCKGALVNVYDEGYRGAHAVPKEYRDEAVDLGRVPTSASFVRDMLKEGRRHD